jgi:hypothetical protein
MEAGQSADLHRMAATYVWWMPPGHALADRGTFLRQVMRLGTWEDARLVRVLFGDDCLRDALRGAPAGALDPRSWVYWHRVLGIEPVPPPPDRPLP